MIYLVRGTSLLSRFLSLTQVVYKFSIR